MAWSPYRPRMAVGSASDTTSSSIIRFSHSSGWLNRAITPNLRWCDIQITPTTMKLSTNVRYAGNRFSSSAGSWFGRHVRDVQLQHQDGHRDGEHRITERDRPVQRGALRN